MTHQARVKRLEETAQGRAANVFIVLHSNEPEPRPADAVTANGERMTLAEARARWPSANRHIFHVSYISRKATE